MKTTNPAVKKVAPDGGYGWVATFGVSLVNLATRSIEPSFGLLFGDLLAELNVGTTGASIIMSALDVMMNFSGLFVGPLLKEFSYRKVAIFGSLLCGLGLALTSPASSVAHIIATYSVINGMGVGLATSAAFVALNHYFKKRRGQAVGLSMAGTAIGMLIMPQLVRILLENYGFRGAVLVLSGLAFHAAVGATLLQPAKWHLVDEKLDIEMEPKIIHTIIKEDEEDDLPEINTLLFNKPRGIKKNFSEVAVGSNGHGVIPIRPTFPRITSNSNMSTKKRKRTESVISNLSTFDLFGSYMQIHIDVDSDSSDEETDNKFIRRVNTHLGMAQHRDSFSKFHKAPSAADFVKSEQGLQMNNPTIEKIKQNFWQRFISLLDVDILKDRTYLNILFGLSIFYVAEMNFKMITPFFLNNLGYSKSETAFGLSMTAITDIIARLVIPPISDRFNVKKRSVFLVSIVFVGITRSIMAEQTEWTQLLIWLSISAFFRGAALSSFTLTVSEHFSLEQLPAAFGWHLIGKAIFVICFGPLIGAIRDLSGSFPLCIHSQTVCIFLGCIAWFIEYTLNYLRRKKADDSDST